jgi:hypothetical protein
MSLFRKEAVSHQSERLTGAITLDQPLSLKLTVLILVSVAAAIIAFLFSAEYSRKETVRGFLMPNKGVIKSFAHQGGTIEKLWVKEGDNVVKGQTLVTLVVQQNNIQGVDLSTQLAEQLNAQSSLLNDEIYQHQQLKSQGIANLHKRELALKKERWALKSQYTLANEKLALFQVQQNKLQRLSKKGFVRLGNNTRLRFDAFPYQRFGFIESEITRIDQALTIPNEIQLPIALQEPVYCLRAKLNQQQMQAFGKAFDLKSGMLFQADIMLEQRTLIEWLLEPIYSLKGRVS